MPPVPVTVAEPLACPQLASAVSTVPSGPGWSVISIVSVAVQPSSSVTVTL